jgi:hypothetical protein
VEKLYIYITAIGLTPVCNSTVHVYTQTVHTIQQYSTHLHTNSTHNTVVQYTFTHKQYTQYSSTVYIYTRTVHTIQQYSTHLHTNSTHNTTVQYTFTHEQYTQYNSTVHIYTQTVNTIQQYSTHLHTNNTQKCKEINCLEIGVPIGDKNEMELSTKFRERELGLNCLGYCTLEGSFEQGNELSNPLREEHLFTISASKSFVRCIMCYISMLKCVINIPEN